MLWGSECASRKYTNNKKTKTQNVIDRGQVNIIIITGSQQSRSKQHNPLNPVAKLPSQFFLRLQLLSSSY